MNEEEKKKKEQEEAKEKAMQTIVDAVTPKAVEAIYAKIQKEQPLRKNIVESGSDSEQKELTGKKQQAAEFLKAMEKGDRTAVKALSAGTSSSGLDLVPTYVSDQVILQSQKYGLVRKFAQDWPMDGINENVPTFTTATAYRAGSDTTALSASNPVTGAVQLRAKTLAVVIPISRVLLQN